VFIAGIKKKGVLVLSLSAPGEGTITGDATFNQGGKQASSVARAAKTKVYGTGTVTTTAPGPVTLTIRPTTAARRALRKIRGAQHGFRAVLAKKGHLTVSVHLAFRSSARLGSTTSSRDFRIKVNGKHH
jgi:hypothetical protein